MTPGVVRGDSDEQNIEKQMGCMAGFLQIFDRNQVLAGKRLYAAKRLSISPAAGSTSPSERSDASAASSFMKETQASPSPEACPSSPESRPARPSLPLPLFEFKDGMRSSWKLREVPRLSLDSRAVVDAKGKLRPREIRTTPAVFSGNQHDASEAGEDLDKQRRSPSVVARLMGLDALPDDGGGRGDPANRAELRRSSSESRVPRDLYRFVDSSTFKNPPPPRCSVSAEVCRLRATESKAQFGIRHSKPDPTRAPLAASLQRKSFFDAQDFFPEPKQSGSLYGEIERRLRMRGIDEPAKDLETLKQILEVVQLKGLLHCNLPSEHQPSVRSSNLVFDHRRAGISGDPPIVVMKPAPKRAGSEPRVLTSRSVPPDRARRYRVEIDRNPRDRSPRSPDRADVARSPTSTARRRPANSAEPLKGTQASQRRIPAVHSPRTSPRKLGSDPMSVQSPRIRRYPKDDRIHLPPVEDDTSTTISESSISTTSQFDFEGSRVEYRAGRSLLERCDKLLDSIAAITSSAAEQVTAVDQQPSPVSVLQSSSLLCDDSSSPSAISKHSIDFKDHQLADWGEELWSPATPTVRSRHGDGTETEEENDDFVYVSEILCATDLDRDPSDVYLMLEKRHQAAGGGASSKASRLHRRLVFDTVVEILDRKRYVSAWDGFSRAAAGAASGGGGAALRRKVWEEVRRMREQVVPAVADLNEVTRGAIRKDMLAGDRGWGEAPVEMSDAVLHIERQIFKDLVAETIRDLADVAGTCRPQLRPRKLVF